MILKWSLNRIDRLDDLVNNDLAFIWVIPGNTVSLDEQQVAAVINFMDALSRLDTLEKDRLKEFLKQFAKENNVKFAAFMKTLRGLISGLKVS